MNLYKSSKIIFMRKMNIPLIGYNIKKEQSNIYQKESKIRVKCNLLQTSMLEVNKYYKPISKLCIVI